MHRSIRRPAALMCLLALWLQMLAPACALGMHRQGFDPFSSICHSAAVASQGEQRKQTPHPPACDHCLLCHAITGLLATDGRPAFVLLDYPIVGPARWAEADLHSNNAVDARRTSQPRGPPHFV